MFACSSSLIRCKGNQTKPNQKVQYATKVRKVVGNMNRVRYFTNNFKKELTP